MKTIERAHTPKRLWEKIKLSKSYLEALSQIDEHMEHWPQILIHKNKQRLTKMHQYLVRMRRMRLKVRPTLERVHKKVDVREKRREIKAEKAALIDKSIEKELLARLKAGTYGDIYNFPMQEYEAALNAAQEEEAEEDEGFVAVDSDEDEDEDGEDLGEDEAEWENDAEGFDEMVEEDGEESEDGEGEASSDDSAGEEGRKAADHSLPTGAGKLRLGTSRSAKSRAGQPPPASAKQPSKLGSSGGASSSSSKRVAPGGKAASSKKPKRREVEYEEEREVAPRLAIDDW